jgi:hypothetical protein
VTGRLTIGLDPGLRVAGIAAVDDAGQLVAAGLLKTTGRGRGAEVWASAAAPLRSFLEMLPDADALVFVHEHMQVYQGGQSRADPADLLELTGVAGVAVGVVAELCDGVLPVRFVSVTPRNWKGQVPKHIHHKRLERALDPRGHEVLMDSLRGHASNQWHNAWDAVGIALWGHKNI